MAHKGNKNRLGKKMSEQSKAAISESLIGNQYRKGIPHDADSKKKISDGLKRAYAEGRRDVETSKRNLGIIK